MRKCAVLAAAVAAVALPSSKIYADFAITALRFDLDATNSLTTAGNGSITGNYGMVEFFAKNLGTGGTGSRLDSVTLTMSDSGPGNLVIGGYSGTGTPSASAVPDLYGQSAISSSAGSYIFKETNTGTTGAPKYVSFVNIMGDPATAGENTPNNITPSVGPIGFSPSPTFANYGYAIKTFNAVYGSTNSVPNTGVNATTANGGLGALFAVAVVPVSDSVNVQGQLGGNTGNGTNFNYTATVIPGDTNFDHSVNFNDLATLGQNYQTTGKSWSLGDVNGDGSVNFNDLAIVGQNYGVTSPSAVGAAVAAPEPASISLLGLGLGGLLLRRRRR